MEKKLDKVRLLLVDDEEDFLASASSALERRNIEVIIADNGREALEICDKQSFDVVVLDVKMPGIDGVELFRRIKAKIPGLPVIILTGHGTIAQAFETSKDGIFDYQTKPCKIDELAAKILEAAETCNREPGKPDSLQIKVLLVDDEEELLDSTAEFLRRRKLKVFTRQSGEEALEFIAENRVDVVVLDIKMPGKDGIETLSRIKDEFQDIEVILLTGHSLVDNAVKGVKLGAFEYLVKPAESEQLLNSIIAAHNHRQKKLDDSRKKTVDDILKRFPE